MVPVRHGLAGMHAACPSDALFSPYSRHLIPAGWCRAGAPESARSGPRQAAILDVASAGHLQPVIQLMRS